jgi:hypothetical protein
MMRSTVFAALSLALALLAKANAEPRTILFADDEDVLYRPGLMARAVEFKKISPDPVIAPEKPWEGMIAWTSVHRDPQSGKYQLWYQAYQERRTEDKTLRCVVCYAESADGRTWIKPKLTLFPFYDEKETNIVLVGAKDGYGDRYGNSVIVDPRDPDPARRYKMAYYDWLPGHGGSGTHVAFSPDGIHWTKHEGLVQRVPFGSKGLQPPFVGEEAYLEIPRKDGRVGRNWQIPLAMSDAMDVLYDAKRGVFVGYGKMWTPGPDGGLTWKHSMGRTESTDFLHWSKPELVLTTNDRDPAHREFHTSPVFMYAGMYFSLNQILDRGQGTIDAELMSSRDGLRWNRDLAGQWVIPRGSADRFDAGSIITNGTPVILEKEMRFYYGAYRGTAIGGVGLNRQEPGSHDFYSGIGLAVTPRDRLVALKPNPQTPVKGQKKGQPQLVNKLGQVTLKPLDLTGVKAITLNADASQGTVRLELLNEDGYRLHGFTRDEAVPLHGDQLAHEARWQQKQLSDLPPGRYQLRVHVESAELFAITLQ